ncbi:hypothetical protein DVH05_003131 [Phytophthora capsici]|nr:hypothetical protein DVH05_003131 [Phytophthora capsici]
MITCDAKNLQLFLAKKDGTWLDEAQSATVTFDDAETQFVEMNPLLWLKNDKHFGANFRPDESQVHVLVALPEMPPRKKQKVGDELAFWQEELDSICEFGQGLDRETDLDTGALLETAQEVFGVLGVNVRKGLYVRQEYWDVYEIMKEKLQSNNEIDRVVLLGSPGIGKSVFGVFLLLLFMSEHKNVAFRAFGSDARPYYFTWNDDENRHEASLRPIAGNRYEGLFDGNDSSGGWRENTFAHSYLFASPCAGNYSEIVKERCTKVYMNPWTKDECQAYTDAVELEDEMEWYHRFNLVGGKPRLLFSVLPTFEALVDEVKSAIPTEIDRLKTMLSGREEMKHILFEMYRDVENPGLYGAVLASGIIEIMVQNADTEGKKMRNRQLSG